VPQYVRIQGATAAQFQKLTLQQLMFHSILKGENKSLMSYKLIST